ncbi:hypothetical protein ACTOVP_00005, partial [Arcanobacterium canis]
MTASPRTWRERVLPRIEVMISQATSFLHLLACNQTLCAHEVSVTVSSFIQEYPSSTQASMSMMVLLTRWWWRELVST